MPRSPTRRASGAASARRSARTPSARSAARKRGSAASTSMPAKRTGPRRLCASTTRWSAEASGRACVARRLADYDREHHLALGGRGLPAPRGIVTRLQRPAKGRGSSHTCSSSRRPARPPSTTCAPSPRWSAEASGRLAWLAAWRRTTASTTWPWRTWRPCGTQRPSALPLRPPVAANRGRRSAGPLAQLPRGAPRGLPPRGRRAGGRGGRRARRAPGFASG